MIDKKLAGKIDFFLNALQARMTSEFARIPTAEGRRDHMDLIAQVSEARHAFRTQVGEMYVRGKEPDEYRITANFPDGSVDRLLTKTPRLSLDAALDKGAVLVVVALTEVRQLNVFEV